jgi:dihydrolipoamide dehydrogenase
MMERKNKVVEELVKGIEMLLQSQRVTTKYAQADLFGTHRVGLLTGGDKREIVEADAIVLAPGSLSKALSSITPDGEKIITSDEALEIKKIPTNIVIVGGGYIGVEFATLFHALGSKVTIVEILETILPGLEGELVRNLRRLLESDGIRILTQSSLKEIRHQDEKLTLTVETRQGLQTISTEKLLIAVGRIPNLNLDFSKAGVETSSNGIRVNRRMETTTPHIYAIGDAIGGVLLAHVAMEEGVLAAENAMGFDRQMDEHPIPLCIFTYPEISSIGLTEKEARERGEIKVGRFPFRSNPKAVISAETEGLIKVIASRETDEILGVHVIGLEACELISIVSSIMRQGVKAKEFSRFIQAHPTIAEALKEAFLDVDGMAIHLPRPFREQKR